MIIVKTKNGDHFINEKAVTEVHHDREKAVVNCYGANGYYSHHEDVEGVVYTNDAQPTSWTNESLEIDRLKAELEKEKRENSIMCEHFGFIREWFFIYQNAFDDIKNAVVRSKNGSKCEDMVIDSLIEQAEKKYAESVKRFDEVRENLDKK